MARNPIGKIQLVALDIDNTLFDWVSYYAASFHTLLTEVGNIVGVSADQLAEEARQIFADEGSIEYPFVIQRMPTVRAHYGKNWRAMMDEAVKRGREAFTKKARETLVPYDGVLDTLMRLKNGRPELPLVALTDAPRYVAMWKLNKLGLLHFFDAVYGLADPALPVAPDQSMILVEEEILVKHHLKDNFGYKGKIRILPDEYEKPGVRGLKTVLMDYEEYKSIKDPTEVLWVGDNLAKDILLGRKLQVRTAWAEYGTRINQEAKAHLLSFSPAINVQKNVALNPLDKDSPRPDLVFSSFGDILGVALPDQGE